MVPFFVFCLFVKNHYQVSMHEDFGSREKRCVYANNECTLNTAITVSYSKIVLSIHNTIYNTAGI